MHKNAKEEILMKCISQDNSVRLLNEIHIGSYGNHAASRTLVKKSFQESFYWPSVVADAKNLV